MRYFQLSFKATDWHRADITCPSSPTLHSDSIPCAVVKEPVAERVCPYKHCSDRAFQVWAACLDKMVGFTEATQEKEDVSS